MRLLSAAPAGEDCYCGAGVDPIVCNTGMANGVCKARFEADVLHGGRLPLM